MKRAFVLLLVAALSSAALALAGDSAVTQSCPTACDGSCAGACPFPCGPCR